MHDIIFDCPAAAELNEKGGHVFLRAMTAQELVDAYERASLRNVSVVGAYLDLSEHSGADLVDQLKKLQDLPKKFCLELKIRREILSVLYVWRVKARRLNVYIIVEARRGSYLVVSKLTRMGFSVLVENEIFNPDLTTELKKIVNHYFHTKTLSVPIQPIHSMFMSWLSGQGSQLGHVYREDPRKYVFVNSDGRKASSARAAERLCFYENSQESAPKAANPSFQDLTGCSVCGGYRICGGIAQRSQSLEQCVAFTELAKVFSTYAGAMRKQFGSC